MKILTSDDQWTAGYVTGRPISLKLLDPSAETGEIEGYASTFNGTDWGGDTIAPGAFAESLTRHAADNTAPAMLWAHSMTQPVGKWTGMGEDARGLRVRGQLNLGTEPGQKAHAHVRAGDVSGLSIGYAVAPGGEKFTSAGRTLTKVHLHEVSIVTVPMDSRARITGVKSLGSVRELEDMLREGGLSRGAARKIAAVGWPALNGEVHAPAPVSDLGDAGSEIKNLLDLEISALKGLIR